MNELKERIAGARIGEQARAELLEACGMKKQELEQSYRDYRARKLALEKEGRNLRPTCIEFAGAKVCDGFSRPHAIAYALSFELAATATQGGLNG